MRLLLIEDSERLRRSVGTGLRNAGYALDVAADGNEGLWYARSNDYGAIILDLMLPGLDGLSLLKTLRSEGRDVHVLVLTAKDAVEDRVAGLQAGADDYLIKPFAFEELLARVQALVRRQHNVKTSSIEVGSLCIDTLTRTARREGSAINLAPREYALLEYLALRRGQVVSRREIEAQLYDEQAEPMSNVVDAAVYALRKKIELPGIRPLIQTRRGMGYILHAEDA
jgi:DNA-binding response OmpR family regulator